MKIFPKQHIVPIMIIMVLLITIGCSTEKNTAGSRWWQSFNAKYNTYYNGSLAYIDGSLEKEQGNKDNFTEMIPLYTVGNKDSRELGSGNFDRAIEKSQKAIKLHSIKKRPQWTKKRKKTERDIEWLNRKEYNPFLWKAWMLLGRSQFMKGSFDEAASTFAYMSRLYATQPSIYGRARAWLAKCYIEDDWIYDAEDVITKIRRDSIHWLAKKEWDYTYADYYIHIGNYEEAIPYLRKVISHEMRRKQKAREWYLMGQLQEAIGNKTLAYKAYQRVIRQNPPYELEFNARIAQTEVVGASESKKMIRRLKRMASSDNNAEYLDQVYYAIGNIYLAQNDTAKAISAYEKGNTKSVRNGIEKGVLLLTLGDLYWEKEDYSNAQRCYGEAIGLLDKDHKAYDQLSERSKVLDELVPYTETIHLQDSLQELAKMPEDERNKAIDRVIEALKKKEKEEKAAQAELEAQQRLAEMGGNASAFDNTTSSGGESGTWYFYNPTTLNQGKATFQKLWGNRQNADDWQRINKTVVSVGSSFDEEDIPEELRDSIMAAEALQDSIEHSLDSAQNDPHKREYYLKQIPFTEEQVAESNKLIADGLYHAGVIFKDKLYNLPRSEKSFLRLTNDYNDYENMDEAYYHLFLLYSQWGQPGKASEYLARLKEEFPESKWTILLSDPNFEENSRFGVHIEDSLYAATYDAFKADRFNEVNANVELSASRFPLGANRDKFIFIGGLSKLNSGDSQGCVDDMQEVVSKYPQSGVSEMAGMIINGVKAGRRLHGGKFDIGSIWDHRSVVLNDSDSINARVFIAERVTNFSFIIAYSPDSINENKLLFELARYNFTNYIVRNFDIEIDDLDGICRMKVSGFRSYDEVLQYARQFYNNEVLMSFAQKGKVIIISDANLELLGTQFSYAEYDQFYEEHFVPLTISTVQLLTEPESVEYEREIESSGGYNDGLFNGGVIEEGLFVDDGEYIDEEEDEGLSIPIDEEEIPETEQEENATEIQAEEGAEVSVEEEGTEILDEETTEIPVEDNTEIQDENTVILEEEGVEVPSEENFEIPEEEDEIEIPTEEEIEISDDEDFEVSFGDD
ncbi:MAG: tetratricopeptide repeat protein, partial [Prevotella sp.]|nr:tetratricopeptide repeat protein [Prevotella sp.]